VDKIVNNRRKPVEEMWITGELSTAQSCPQKYPQSYPQFLPLLSTGLSTGHIPNIVYFAENVGPDVEIIHSIATISTKICG
jgi:hypothetical protein